MLLENRVAIVTGASRGIGADIARRFAREGARVAVVARTERPEDSPLPGTIHETVADIEKAGGVAFPIAANLRMTEDLERIARTTEERLGPADILVNNAAVSFFASFDRFPVKRLDLMFQIQVRAPFVLSQLVLPGMRQREEGWILNITSKWAEHPAPPYPEWATQGGSIPYGIVKIGLDRLSTGLAAEVRSDGIRVNALSTSGLVPTPGTNLLGLNDYPLERPGATVTAALALCAGGRDMTGRVTHAHEILDELGISADAGERHP